MYASYFVAPFWLWIDDGIREIAMLILLPVIVRHIAILDTRQKME